ncbi:hypothetical protein [Mechercharimyces sp. CAU 1602]|uniref:hypothetical protein n=1 Tax=Mechercharimyces sp. CAU 1602 TaxID=2973933 RepID=UPI0021618F9D|nr:hypothetical protein [Mechercharimyces sp. CAU 1602]MCS1350042.1 hypothetical protein [Mechercharimyces sp. CAU 1602]
MNRTFAYTSLTIGLLLTFFTQWTFSYERPFLYIIPCIFLLLSFIFSAYDEFGNMKEWLRQFF